MNCVTACGRMDWMTSMMTDDAIAKLYRDACNAAGALPADVDVSDFIDLAEGRLAGERRRRLVELIACSPAAASAYRMAKAGGEWSRALAADLAGTVSAPSTVVRALPARQRTYALRRHPLALAATVSAMAIGAVFVAQQLKRPTAVTEAEFAAEVAMPEADAILATSFDARRGANGDRIFSSNDDSAGDDSIFGEGFGKGS